MALLLDPIEPRNFELIRDRIAQIIALELPEQAILNDDNLLNAKVFIERFIPLDKTDMPAINVMLSNGNFEDPFTKHDDNTYTYFIDVYTSAKTDATNNGDRLASVRLQRLIGVIMGIIGNPQYKTLGFEAPSISHRRISLMQIVEPKNNQDASSIMMGRLTLTVRTVENYELITPVQLALSLTEVRIANSDEGYGWEVEPSGDCKPLDVIVCDEDGNVITTYQFPHNTDNEIEVQTMFAQQVTATFNGETVFDDEVFAFEDVNVTIK
jgi:hypothetical protein